MTKRQKTDRPSSALFSACNLRYSISNTRMAPNAHAHSYWIGFFPIYVEGRTTLKDYESRWSFHHTRSFWAFWKNCVPF